VLTRAAEVIKYGAGVHRAVLLGLTGSIIPASRYVEYTSGIGD
jgi:hypothetical protein